MTHWPAAPVSRFTRRWAAVGATALCTLVAVVTPQNDAHRRSLSELHDYLHVLGFAFVAAALLYGFPASAAASRRSRLLRASGIFALTVADGLFVELMQAASGGRASAPDVARDAIGAAAASLLAAFVPSAHALVDEARASLAFPILAGFERPAELERFSWSSGSVAEFVPPGAGGDRGALRVLLRPGRFPGLRLEYFPRDWRGYESLRIDCTNAGDTPLEVTVRIDDLGHGAAYADRYNGTFVLAPGRSTITIPLADVQSAPRHRWLDLARVRRVVVFAVDLREPRCLVFHEFRLASARG